MYNVTQTKLKTIDMAFIAMFAVLIAICSWISIPTTVPFTLQTFAIFCTLGLLGGRKGTLAIVIYILIGALGAPVFANFSSGFGQILGNTGGYIIGFLFLGLVYWLITSIFGSKLLVSIIAMAAGLIVCYVFGTSWFMIVYMHKVGSIGLATVLGWCVIPFIVPDLIKLTLASVIVKRLSSYVKL